MKTTNFLPESYKLPSSTSHYMKVEEGQNKIRILSSAIVGWEYWQDTEEGKRKPIRVKSWEEIPKIIKGVTIGRNKPKHFWAFVVWNYKIKEIQILEVTQKSVMNGIETLIKTDEWNDPREYDLTITRKKTGSEIRDVEYSVVPNPQKPVDPETLERYKTMTIDLEKFYKGGDPFEVSEEELVNIPPNEETPPPDDNEEITLVDFGESTDNESLPPSYEKTPPSYEKTPLQTRIDYAKSKGK